MKVLQKQWSLAKQQTFKGMCKKGFKPLASLYII